jgi:FkbM family methyltransferase
MREPNDLSQSEQPIEAVPPRVYEHEFVAMKRCKHGTFLYNVHDGFIGTSLELYGQWCEGEMEALGQIIKPGDVVLDIGANIGTHTIFFSRRVADQGVVVAFEPQRLVFQNLCANVALNALTNVIAKQQGVGRRAETIRLPVINPLQDVNFGALPMRDDPNGEPVEVIRIDDLPIGRCNLIKIDVEGMECDVLEGARESIGKHRPILFVENNTLDRSAAIVALIDSLEYDAYWHISSYFDPANFFQNRTNVFAHFTPEANLICVHRNYGLEIRGLPKVAGVEDNWQRALARQVSAVS